MSSAFLFQAVVYLGAAVLVVPLAKRMGLSAVLGYLAAGILIGPFAIGFVGQEGQDILHFAEFGVVMMLFLIGLELEPATFWKMRFLIIGMGGMQVIITAILGMLGAILMGFEWKPALTMGCVVALSSTAIVLQTLKEKNLMRSVSGKTSFSVLLFQDISVIPMLAALPLLATSEGLDHQSIVHYSIMSGLPAWMQTAALLGSVFLIVISGKYIIVPVLRMISKARVRELFTGTGLLIVLGISLLMELVGLSHALGAFLGGVVLANSEFKHELESDLEPFKGLLLGLFFMAVGASIDFKVVLQQPALIILLVFIIMMLKSLILFAVGKLFKLSFKQNLLFAFGLGQIGEFSFVLLSFAGQLDILSEAWISKMMVITALSMGFTPIFGLILERLVLPKVGNKTQESRHSDTIHEKHKVILIGFSHFGSTIGRFLRANGIEATILDNDSDRVDLLRKMGFKVYYGDATRLDLLESAGIQDAKLVISAIGNMEVNIKIAETIKRHFPHVELLVRAKNRYNAYDLLDIGVQHVYREGLHTSVRLAADALIKLGYRSYTVQRSMQNFIKYDEKSLRRLAKGRHNKQNYIMQVRNEMIEQEKLLKNDIGLMHSETDHAWDSEHMRDVIKQLTATS